MQIAYTAILWDQHLIATQSILRQIMHKSNIAIVTYYFYIACARFSESGCDRFMIGGDFTCEAIAWGQLVCADDTRYRVILTSVWTIAAYFVASCS